MRQATPDLIDWSHEQVEIAGAPQKVKVAHLRLCHSRRFYIRAYPRESQEIVFDAHNLALPAGPGQEARRSAQRRAFLDWELPPTLTKLRRRLGSGDEADRRFVRVLSMVLSDGQGAVEAAVAEALESGVASNDVVINILARHREPPQPDQITTSLALTLVHAPVADCARYDLLRGDRAAA